MASVTVSKPTITYLNLLGRAEVARLILEDAGIDYDFNTITNWKEIKSQYVASGKTPFGQLPLYEEPGLGPLVQSNAIARYLAKKHGYNGASELEATHIDQVNEGVTDLLDQLVQLAFNTPEAERPAATEKFNKETLPNHLGIFTKLLEKNGNNGFLVGSKLSYADLSLYVTMIIIFERVPGSKDVTESFPTIKCFLEGVSNRNRIKAYLARNVYAQH